MVGKKKPRNFALAFGNDLRATKTENIETITIDKSSTRARFMLRHDKRLWSILPNTIKRAISELENLKLSCLQFLKRKKTR